MLRVPARRQARRRRRDDVAEALRRGFDPRAGGVGDVPAAAQRAGDRRRRDARVLRDLVDADHVVTSISNPVAPALSRRRATPSCRRGADRPVDRAARRDHDTARERDRRGAEVRDDRHIPVAECHDVRPEAVDPGAASRRPGRARGADARSAAVEREGRGRLGGLHVARERRPLARAGAASCARRAEAVRRRARRPRQRHAAAVAAVALAAGAEPGRVLPHVVVELDDLGQARAPRPGTGRTSRAARASASSPRGRGAGRPSGIGLAGGVRADAVPLRVLRGQREARRVAHDVVVREHPGARRADGAVGRERVGR